MEHKKSRLVPERAIGWCQDSGCRWRCKSSAGRYRVWIWTRISSLASSPSASSRRHQMPPITSLYVTDFNDITYHFIEFIHVHLENTKPKALGGGPAIHQTMGTQARYQTPVSNQFLVNSGASGSHGSDISKSVPDVFQDPTSFTLEHGLHMDDVARRLGMPRAKIMEAIVYHVDGGNIYSTIDDDHYKSACNGCCTPCSSSGGSAAWNY